MAKEANEDAKRFKYLSALEKPQSANTSTSTSAPTSPTVATGTEQQTDAAQIQIDVKKEEVVTNESSVAPKSPPAKAVESAVASPKTQEPAAAAASTSPAKANNTPTAAETDSSKKGKKKKNSDGDKVKPKCGCVIS